MFGLFVIVKYLFECTQNSNDKNYRGSDQIYLIFLYKLIKNQLRFCLEIVKIFYKNCVLKLLGRIKK